MVENDVSTCEISSGCRENWAEKKGLEISSNRLYSPPTFVKKIMLLIYRTLR